MACRRDWIWAGTPCSEPGGGPYGQAAVSAEGLYQVGSLYTWHATLYRAWRGQTVPRGGLQNRAQGRTPFCMAHGGGKRCQAEGCIKAARGGDTHCVAHGGGRRCQEEGCSEGAVYGGTQRCKGAWRGQALRREGLHQVRSRRYGALCGAWRGQALSRGRLHQGSPRRHTALQKAWWGQAMPACGLLTWGGRRHGLLRHAWGRQALPARGLPQGSRSSSQQCVLQAMSPARAARRCTVAAWRGQAPQATSGIEEFVRGPRRRVESAGPPTGQHGPHL
jgi:hypothetical protein